MSIPSRYQKGGADRAHCLQAAYKFSSLHALATAAQEAEKMVHTHGKSSTKPDCDFSGGLTFKDAVRIGLEGGGWPEGVDQFKRLALAMDVKFTGTRSRPENCIAGSRVHVGRALTGRPKSMVRVRRQPSHKKVFTLGVSIGAICYATQKQMNNRGVAVLGAIKELESKGYSIELWACSHDTDHIDARDDDGTDYKAVDVRFDTLIKPANATLTVGDMAYPMAHAAFFRRLIFSLMETRLGKEMTGGGYGNGLGTDYDEYDLHIPYLSNPHECNTPDGALNWVRAKLDKQIEKIKTTRPS